MNYFQRFWKFLKEDTWQSWLVSLVLAFVIIKFIFFPTLSFVLATDLPLVVVESCSMYHESGLDDWWTDNGVLYSSFGIDKEIFSTFDFRRGMDKGDIILVSGRGEYELGDVIIFQSSFAHPIIHRLVAFEPMQTKGDHNSGQLEEERNIAEEQVIGKAVLRVPMVGWLKLIFFEGFRPAGQRGFCK